LDDVSNIANPTFDAELAISITVNAKLPKTPHRKSPATGASELIVDSLDKKTPLEEQQPEGHARRNPRTNGEDRLKFQGGRNSRIEGVKTAKTGRPSSIFFDYARRLSNPHP
jgi:hypothetical protein